MDKCVLFLFNSSMYAVQPWLDNGYRCVSVDWDDTDHGGQRVQDTHPLLTRLSIDLSQPTAYSEVMTALTARYLFPGLVVSFAPCTDLSVAGAKHFKAKREKDPLFQRKAADMAILASQFGCAYVVENPVSVLSTLWRKPDFITHPCDWAGYCPDGPHPEAPDLYPPKDTYYKKTCLWSGNGFRMPPPLRMTPEHKDNPGWAKLGGKSERTKHLRSLTPRGISMAFFVANAHLVEDRA